MIKLHISKYLPPRYKKRGKRNKIDKDNICPKCGSRLKVNTIGIYCSNNCGFETII